jgi:hypothetical protein
VLIDSVLPIAARDEFAVVSIMPAGVTRNEILYRQAILQVLKLASQLIDLGLSHDSYLSL